MKKLILFMSALALLLGCSHKEYKSPEYWYKHQDEMKKKLDSCTPDLLVADEECKTAALANDKIQKCYIKKAFSHNQGKCDIESYLEVK